MLRPRPTLALYLKPPSSECSLNYFECRVSFLPVRQRSISCLLYRVLQRPQLNLYIILVNANVMKNEFDLYFKIYITNKNVNCSVIMFNPFPH
jgi:hypothetical protein